MGMVSSDAAMVSPRSAWSLANTALLPATSTTTTDDTPSTEASPVRPLDENPLPVMPPEPPDLGSGDPRFNDAVIRNLVIKRDSAVTEASPLAKGQDEREDVGSSESEESSED